MYFTDEVVFIITPHVAVSSDVNDHSFKRVQCPFLWLDQECHTFPMSEKSMHKICTSEQKELMLSLLILHKRFLFQLKMPFSAVQAPTFIFSLLYFLGLHNLKRCVHMETSGKANYFY